MKFSVKDFYSKCEQIGSFLRLCSQLQNKSLRLNFIYSYMKAAIFIVSSVWLCTVCGAKAFAKFNQK